MTKSKKVAFCALHFVLWIAVLTIYVAIIMWLWNWLVPAITGWSSISYQQALGLFALSHLLGGKFMYGGHRRFHHKHGKLNMQRMSREERKRVLRSMTSSVGNDIFSFEVTSEMTDDKQQTDGGKTGVAEDGKK